MILWPTNTKWVWWSLMYEPKVAYRNKLVLVWLSACLGITFFSTAKHFIFKPLVPPPRKKLGALLPRTPRTLVTPLNWTRITQFMVLTIKLRLSLKLNWKQRTKPVCRSPTHCVLSQFILTTVERICALHCSRRLVVAWYVAIDLAWTMTKQIVPRGEWKWNYYKRICVSPAVLTVSSVGF